MEIYVPLSPSWPCNMQPSGKTIELFQNKWHWSSSDTNGRLEKLKESHNSNANQIFTSRIQTE